MSKELVERLRRTEYDDLDACKAADLIERQAAQIALLRDAVAKAHIVGGQQAIDEALAIQPDDSALKAWLGEPVARMLKYIGTDPYPKRLAPIARTFAELPSGTYPETWEDVGPLYAPKGLK